MDPDETLREMRAICSGANGDYDDAERLADLFRSLDNWITKGGFLPAAWRKK